MVRLLLEQDTSGELHLLAFKEAAEAGHLDAVEVFLQHHVQYAQSDLALEYCVRRHQLHVFDRLVGISSDKARGNALTVAASEGLMLVVEHLLISSNSFPPAVLQNALNQAAINGHLDIVKKLTPLTTCNAISDALVCAVLNNRLRIVMYLLPLSDPKYNNSKALQYAVEDKKFDIADMLYPLSDPQVVLDNMILELGLQPGDAALQYLEDRFENERVRKVLSSEVTQTNRAINRKM